MNLQVCLHGDLYRNLSAVPTGGDNNKQLMRFNTVNREDR